ncbi:hypothetical protein GCM10022226_59320 [Sphaerisporangium flaviroseum]|uniref:Uncharacterized protein n=1 Tax=Sphaerisporangium flaviroseum TaxID=509199 RepID=A0ABP7IZ16_9ACTN
MSWLILALIVAAAVLAPLFGADTRDGRDWRPSTPLVPDREHTPTRQPRIRMTGSHERPSAGRVPVACARQVRAGG